MSARRLATLPALLLVLVLTGAWTALASDATPVRTVDELHAHFIVVMRQADSLDVRARAKLLAPPVEGAFDLPFMAIKSLGLAARDLSAFDRERWVDTFARFIISNYARRFTGYSGQRFESVAEVPAPKGQVVVRSRLMRSGRDDVQLDYRLRPTADGWKIIDIYAEGTTSMLALRRAEFAHFLENEGFEGLVAAVQAKADREEP